MKKVLIIGASGSLVPSLVKELENQNDIELTLFVRNKLRIIDKGNAEVIEGNAENYEDVKCAVAGQDIIYINLAGDLEAMGNNIVKAMEETDVKRVIAISAIGIYKVPMKPVLAPYRKLADVIENSDLDYTILRPDWFTDEDEVDYVITTKEQPEIGTAISRKSIAAFVATLIQDPEKYVKENLGISKPN